MDELIGKLFDSAVAGISYIIGFAIIVVVLLLTFAFFKALIAGAFQEAKKKPFANEEQAKPEEPKADTIPEKTTETPKFEVPMLDIIDNDMVVVESPNVNKTYPYRLTETVFTDKEAVFYHSLLPIATKYGLTVFTKMRVADLVWIPKNHPERIKWFNHISAKHIDFVLCNAKLTPVLLIELDDKTHDYASNKERDEFKNNVFLQLNMPMLRVRRWQSDELERQIADILGIKEKAGL
ncbi:MAG: DUF2726 domain-containing protein [Oscillospiraceae bacterium]|nr:DUF2726 domain-containing protein [Oscillospiraceae bacterium]